MNHSDGPRKLDPEELRWTLDPLTLAFDSTRTLEPLTEIVGQRRGVEALRFGMGIKKKGYNVVVTGAARTGRLSTVRRILAELAGAQDNTLDLCYVYNFKTPDAPTLLTFPAGQGARFRKDVNEWLEGIKRLIPDLFDSQKYISRKKEIMEAHERKTRDFFVNLEKRVKEAGFVLVNMQVGQTQRPEVVPLIDGEPVHLLALEERIEKGRFPRDEFLQLQRTHKELKEVIDGIFLELRELNKEVKKKFEDMDRHLFLNSARVLLAPVLAAYPDKKVEQHGEAMLEHMADNLDALRLAGQPQQEGQFPMGFMPPPAEIVYHPYQVNLLVDNADVQGQPVIVESFPTYRNLFGSIERVLDRSGVWHTDYTRIKAGSFIKANGGFLVLNLLDALLEPGVWPTLKRAMKTSEIEIQTFDPYYFITSTGIKPEPIPIAVKVVVLAEPHLYGLLQRFDEDVLKIFKVQADFDVQMERNEEAVLHVARFVRSAADENHFRHLDRGALALLVEHAVRMTGRKEKISTAFPQLEDLLAEADDIAGRLGSELVLAEHVEQAVSNRIDRASLIDEHIQEAIDRGSIFIDVEGAAVGQVNGLSVFAVGEHYFGKPSRITAVTAMGKEGIISIEREAELSGAIHNKGVFILAGYLRSRYAQDKPLTLSASIAFEQSYGGVDGDSASSTELYALLSSLADVPLVQGIAVTGSVNQRGEIQPIGGVNEKIEGFFLCCKHLGLTGQQGVLIPEANVKDLMLRKEVIEAVEQGRFAIWAARHIDEGIALLTGIPAGQRQADGSYPAESINARVDARLKALAEGLRQFSEIPDKSEKNH